MAKNWTKPKPIYFIHMYKEVLALNNLQWLRCRKTESSQNIIYLVYVYKEYLALNNLQWLIRHKTVPSQNLYI